MVVQTLIEGLNLPPSLIGIGLMFLSAKYLGYTDLLVPPDLQFFTYYIKYSRFFSNILGKFKLHILIYSIRLMGNYEKTEVLNSVMELFFYKISMFESS